MKPSCGKVIRLCMTSITIFLLGFTSKSAVQKANLAEQNATITIGSTLPLRSEGRIISQGIDAAFSAINKLGGIRGKKLKFVVLDDKKSIGRSLKNIKTLQDKTSIFLNIFNTGVVSYLLPDIKAKKLLVFAPEENADVLQKAQYRYMIHTKPAVRESIKALLDYAIDVRKRKKIAIFYVDDDAGRLNLAQARELLKSYNLTPVVEASHPRRLVKVEVAVEKIAQAEPNVILCLSRRHATYNFVRQALNRGLAHVLFCGTSYLQPLQRILKRDRGVNFISTSLVPDARTSTLPIVQDYRKHLKEEYPKAAFSQISLLAYINASILIEIMRRIEGPVTPEAIVGQAEKIKNFNLRGLILDFDPHTRLLMHDVWFIQGYGKKWVNVAKQKIEVEEEKLPDTGKLIT